MASQIAVANSIANLYFNITPLSSQIPAGRKPFTRQQTAGRVRWPRGAGQQPADAIVRLRRLRDGRHLNVLNDALIAAVRSGFTSSEFAEDKDLFRVITYTNAAADRYNGIIRQMIYGDVSMPFWPDEMVVLKSPLLDEDGNIVLPNNAEVIVQGDPKPSLFAFDFEALEAETLANGRSNAAMPPWRFTIPCWNVVVQYGNLTHEFQTPADPNAIKQLEAQVRAQATMNHRRWSQYFSQRDKIPSLMVSYAMTTHRAQGSTFGNIFIDLRDIQANRNVQEMLRLLYVAASRPRKALVII